MLVDRRHVRADLAELLSAARRRTAPPRGSRAPRGRCPAGTSFSATCCSAACRGQEHDGHAAAADLARRISYGPDPVGRRSSSLPRTSRRGRRTCLRALTNQLSRASRAGWLRPCPEDVARMPTKHVPSEPRAGAALDDDGAAAGALGRCRCGRTRCGRCADDGAGRERSARRPGCRGCRCAISAGAGSPRNSTAAVVAPVISTSTIDTAEFRTRMPTPSGVAASPMILNPTSSAPRRPPRRRPAPAFGRCRRQPNRRAARHAADDADAVS